MSSLPVIPLSTWAKGKSDDEVSDFLKRFSCKKNKEVQWFLRKLSMRFARLNISATHLVLSEDFERIVAYYTLVCKRNRASSLRVPERHSQGLRIDTEGGFLFGWIAGSQSRE